MTAPTHKLSTDQEMLENTSGAPVFDDEFRVAPIRWVVNVHIALALTTILCFLCFPNVSVVKAVGLSVVLAQWALLLIWLTLCGKKSLRRMFAVAAYMELMFIVQVAPSATLSQILSFAGMVIAFLLYGEILSLPLSFVRDEGLRARRLLSGQMPPASPLQYRMSRLLWMTALTAFLFGAVQAGRRGKAIENAIAGLIVFLVGAAIVLTWTRVCVWIAMSPGKIMPRLAVAAYQWLLGTLLIVHGLGPVSLGLLREVCIGATATAILLATLVLIRRQGYYAILKQPGAILADDLANEPHTSE